MTPFSISEPEGNESVPALPQSAILSLRRQHSVRVWHWVVSGIVTLLILSTEVFAAPDTYQFDTVPDAVSQTNYARV